MPIRLPCLIAFLSVLSSPIYANQLEEFAKAFLEKPTEETQETETEAEETASEAGTAAAADNDAHPQVSAGLKAALTQGVDFAIKTLGKEDGFFANELVKIPLPDGLQTVKKGLAAVGQEQLADDFVLTMNRAAEQAVPETAEVLTNAVKNMSVADAMQILQGDENAATEYFRRVSESDLLEKLAPIVKQSMDDTGVTSAYKTLMKQSGPLSGLLGQESMDIDQYVTQQSLNGLFTVIAEEEKRIRTNPVARTTDLLKQIFGQ